MPSVIGRILPVNFLTVFCLINCYAEKGKKEMGSYELYDVIKYLLFSIFLLIPYGKIFSKAGLNPSYAFVAFIPYVGLFLPVVILVFSKWNIKKDNV